MTPEVECTGCGRKAPCAVMKDGTVYRPFTWAYPDRSQLRGVCSECQAKKAASAFLEKATAMHLADSSRSAKSIVEELTASLNEGGEP